MLEPSIARTAEEDDPEHALRIQQQRYAQRVQQRLREERGVASVIVNTYRTAWTDFYSREPGQSEQLLRSLEVTTPHPPPSLDDLFEDADFNEISLCPAPSAATFDLWSSDSQRRSKLLMGVTLALPQASTYAYPKYESCTPSVEAIRYNGDPRILIFIPCADEPGFEVELYASKHMQLAWQTEWFDVDFKLIAAVALRRLKAIELDHEKIDRFKPRSLPSPGSSFMASLGKRDLPRWSSDTLQLPHVITTPTTTTHLLSEVNGMLSVFCASLTCSKAKCMTHDTVSPAVILVPPTKSNAEMRLNSRVKCGDSCFRQYSYAPLLAELPVDQDICDLLKQYPDQSPCRLAVLARTTCHSVFHHRCHIFPDSQTNTPNADNEPDVDLSLPFCVHSGSCKWQDNCACAVNKRECQRRCRCAMRCSLHHVGCKCARSLSYTPCSCKEPEDKVWMECDPEYCRTRKPRGKQSQRPKHKCANMHSQLNKVPHLSVKVGSHGLGTFAESQIPKGAFIGEYIAEMIPIPENEEGGEELDQAQGMRNDFRGLNYFFDLPLDTYLLDAATVGNSIRCINCPDDKFRGNVEADNRQVDGDIKVMFFATKAIQRGQELMLWYGDFYWKM